MSRVFISIFAALVLLAGCSDEEDILPTQKTKIVSYLTGTHSPKLVAYEELEEGSDEPYFTTSGNAVYRYIAGINNPDRVNWTEVTRTSKVTVTFSAYVFTFANIVTPATSTTNLTVPYYSNDPVLIAAMEDPENGPGLTPGAWSSEPLEIDMRGSGIIKGLYDALLGCREGDYVESYMTYNMAYGDINFSTIPKESPVAYFFTVNSVESNTNRKYEIYYPFFMRAGCRPSGADILRERRRRIVPSVRESGA